MAIPATPAARGVTVLLVDDQPIIGEAVRRMLAGEEGITLHYCQQAAAALEMAAEVRPTVILQDLVMPEIDGLELVRRAVFRCADHRALHEGRAGGQGLGVRARGQ